MSIATMGAFAIGEYAEGVAVMFFYAVVELVHDAAVSRAKRNIKALLDIRPETANVLMNGRYNEVHPEEVSFGATLQVKAGEKVPLDGTMLSEGRSFNTAALTGDSTPATIVTGEQILPGLINVDKVVEIEIVRELKES